MPKKKSEMTIFDHVNLITEAMCEGNESNCTKRAVFQLHDDAGNDLLLCMDCLSEIAKHWDGE